MASSDGEHAHPGNLPIGRRGGVALGAGAGALGRRAVDPWSVTSPAATELPADRDGMHSGVGGLAHVLAEIRLARPWTARGAGPGGRRSRSGSGSRIPARDRRHLLRRAGQRDRCPHRARAPTATSTRRSTGSATWPRPTAGPRRSSAHRATSRARASTTSPSARRASCSVRSGPAGTAPPGPQVAEHAADVLLAEAEHVPTGTNWRFVPPRFLADERAEMPNLSHGVAGHRRRPGGRRVELDRPDLVDAARSGAEHLVSLGDRTEEGFVVPRDDPAHVTRHGPGHLHLVPRPDRHLAALRGAGPGRRRRGRRREPAGLAPPLPAQRADVRAARAAATPASGTTTAAAAARRAWATCSSTRGTGRVTRRTWTSRCSWPTRWSSARCWTGRTRTGGSSSTAPTSRCCHPASAGCRVRPASRRTSSALPASSGPGRRRCRRPHGHLVGLWLVTRVSSQQETGARCASRSGAPPTAFPIVFLHGTPGGRLNRIPDENVYRSLGIAGSPTTVRAMDIRRDSRAEPWSTASARRHGDRRPPGRRRVRGDGVVRGGAARAGRVRPIGRPGCAGTLQRRHRSVRRARPGLLRRDGPAERRRVQTGRRG